MKQSDLECVLQGLEPLKTASPRLEQYPTPPCMAAEILYTALGNGHLEDRSVVDLGCGNGVFAIGARLLGARRVLGVDVDPKAIAVAERNAAGLGCDVRFLCADVKEVSGEYDTCLQNPPFGSQTRHADVPFLEKAMEVASVVYTLHNSESEEFIAKLVRRNHRDVELVQRYKFEIRHTFEFHSKERVFTDVTLFCIER
jgi:putative methylase